MVSKKNYGTCKVKKGKKDPSSKNLYIDNMVKLFRFLSRKTRSKFNLAILNRLLASRKNLPSISISSIISKIPKNTEKIVVVIGKVLNDERAIKTPKITLCPLKISNTALNRLKNAGGTLITLDRLAHQTPLGKNTILLRGKKN